ncbi:hypothetical protein ACTFIR_006519 [Dictyostelium discoideum]
MSNFQNQEINIGSVVLGDRSLNNGQYGDKKSIRHVDFDVPFSGFPKVSLGINFLDASSSQEQTRIRCIAQNITSKGMDISFTTWNDNTVYDVAVDYVAIYNPKFGNSNNKNINDNNNFSNTNTNQQRNQYNDNENENNNYQQQSQQTYYENTNNNNTNNNNNNNESEDNYKQQQQQQQGRYQENNNNNNRNDNDNDNDYQSQSQSQSNNFNGKNVNIKSDKFNNYIRDNNGKGDMSQTARNNETWIITSANNNGDLYYIHNRYNHYLSSNGERVLVGEKNDSSIWKISQRRQGVYSIQNYKNSNYLSSTVRNELKTNVKVVNSWEEFNFNFVQDS